MVLPQVTLCAATSVNVAATIRALEVSLDQVDFAACKLFTDAKVVPDHRAIEIVPIARLSSAAAYSDFLLRHMVDYLETSHCLIAQWDGHVLDAARWRTEFLDYDYIGATWPQFHDGHDIGNGGFSLRSRRLMADCREPGFTPSHPEDIAIGRTNRTWLEGRGMRFAPSAFANQFAAERAGDIDAAFGYHGVWHMPHAVGVESFWHIYRALDDKSTIRRDFATIFKNMGQGRQGLGRRMRLLFDHMRRYKP
ncbi:DUF5672 family protein [Sphingobium sp. CCH11-B1]|uniref:DUF5672 family protein n=1 Tax=Sphingobium sp. CCH11-B1 TaxID=1768781 RepID=UPI0022B24558|nr:DUF5672 family protein [Sphingobium sp. CCH11-B1]